MVIDPPVIRRGRSGHCCDAALEGVSHHAVVPNVNVMEDVEARITRLRDDEKRSRASRQSAAAQIVARQDGQHAEPGQHEGIPGTRRNKPQLRSTPTRPTSKMIAFAERLAK